ncbi:MAG: hypothetical protein ACK562_15540 [Acidobacteriota bacterium]
MPTIDLVLAGVHLVIESQSLRLIDLFTDYFSYYFPQVWREQERPLQGGGSPRIRLRLICVETLAAPDRFLPVDAELISRTGVLGLWKANANREGEYYFHTEVAAFRVDVGAGEIVGYVAPRAVDYPHILANTYAMFPLLLVLREQGIYHLHAAAVISPRGRVWLISGAQRAGKTTLTTALGLAGWRPLSDDSLLLSGKEGAEKGASVEILALRKYFHLGDQLLSRWPQLEGMVRHHQYLDRTCVGALDFFGTRQEAERPIARIDYLLLPRISGEGQSHLRRATSGEGLLMLGEQSVYLQLWRERTREQWELLEQIARGAQTYRLDSGHALLDDPQLAARLLTAAEEAAEGNPGPQALPRG